MKYPALTLTIALSLGAVPSFVRAQTTVVTTAAPAAAATVTETTTSAGTVTEFAPTTNRIIVRTAAGAPATYSVTKQTTYVDEAGHIVSAETIRPGAPTTVYYTTVAGVPTVSKVVVTRAVATPTVVVPAARTTTTETTETTTTTIKK